MLLTTGDVLHNRYRIVKLLAQGGFGTLYRAWDINLSRPCVVKENLASTQDAQRQFLREAKILANLSHENLPRVTDYFLIQNQGQYLVMDFVEGQDLDKILEDRGGPLPEERVLSWCGQICDALSYLHSQKPPVIHRDIKPANIRITPEGKAVLVDFGIAKVYDPQSKTTQGAQAVSPGYSPYEQYGKGKTDARTDIYALGATTYALLTAQEPVESIQRVVKDPLLPARQLNPNLSMRTSAALMRAMQLDPSQRFQTAADFKLAITPPAPVQAPPPVSTRSQSQNQPAAGYAGRSSPPWGWMAAVGILSLVVLILIGQIVLGRSSSIVDVNTQAQHNPTSTGAISATSVVIPASISGATASPTGEVSPTLTPIVYFVQSGDTCSEIAEAFGVRVKDIVSQNEGLAPDCAVLYAGQPLLIPQVDGPIGTPRFFKSPTAAEAQVTQVSSADGMHLIYVPAGEFRMGADETDAEAAEVERPAHAVYLSAYWIDQTEVTNAMYQRCVEDGGCKPPQNSFSKTREQYFGNPAFAEYPVIYVSWADADAYCRWADRRLPSEAEWEKAARGLDKRIFPWGDAPPGVRLANFGENLGDTSQVGSFPTGASPFGVLDMAGNVAEWVSDWFGADFYTISPYRDPKGPKTGDFRMIRGGSWFNAARGLRTTARLWNYPDLISETIGFRCAR